jgi:hypothetical protein
MTLIAPALKLVVATMSTVAVATTLVATATELVVAAMDLIADATELVVATTDLVAVATELIAVAWDLPLAAWHHPSPACLRDLRDLATLSGGSLEALSRLSGPNPAPATARNRGALGGPIQGASREAPGSVGLPK